MGILVDFEKGQIYIPQDKLLEIKLICRQWSNRSCATRHQLQSLLGRLLYICHSGNSNPVPFLIPLVVVPIGSSTSGSSNWNYH